LWGIVDCGFWAGLGYSGARTEGFVFDNFSAFLAHFARLIAREMVLNWREIGELVRFNTHPKRVFAHGGVGFSGVSVGEEPH